MNGLMGRLSTMTSSTPTLVAGVVVVISGSVKGRSGGGMSSGGSSEGIMGGGSVSKGGRSIIGLMSGIGGGSKTWVVPASPSSS